MPAVKVRRIEQVMTDIACRIGILGVEDGWSSQQLLEAVKRKTGFGVLIDMDCISTDLESGAVRCNGVDLLELDAVIVKKMGREYSPRLLDRLEILHYIEQNGVRVFSPPSSLALAINRLAGTLRLSEGGIPIPPTLITENPDLAVESIRGYGKAVLKPLYSTKARGMKPVRAGDEDLAAVVRDFKAQGNQMIYVQKMVELHGRDLGLVFLGGEYVATYARVSGSDTWNTTIHHGGTYEKYDPDAEIIELARRAQALFRLDFTSVDVALTDDGPVVFEVSAFGGFRGLKEANNIDAATLYAEYVVERLG